MDATTLALNALFATLEAGLPARLTALDADRTAPDLPLSTSAIQFFPHLFTGWDGVSIQPVVAVSTINPRQGQRTSATTEWLINVRLDCRFPCPAGTREPAFEAGRAFGAAVYDVIEQGDGRGRWMVGNDSRVTVCRPRPMGVDPTLRAPEAGSTIPISRTLPEFEIQVWI